MKSEVLTLNGVTFRRYPHSTSQSARVYYHPNHRHKREGMGPYHVELWKLQHGPIPDGWHIHHKDHNPLNNDLSNLECLSPGDHSRRHWAEKPLLDTLCQRCDAPFQSKDPKSRFCSKICLHRHKEGQRRHEGRTCSECGKPFSVVATRKTRTCSHACAAQKRVRDRAALEHTCTRCGKTWPSRCFKGDLLFCSAKCRDAHYAATGRFLEDRACVICGVPYRKARSSPIRTCSRACGYKLRHANYLAQQAVGIP